MSRSSFFTTLAMALTVVLSQPGEAQMHHPGRVECLAFSDDGRYLVTVTRPVVENGESTETEVRVWDVNVGIVVTEVKDFQRNYNKESGDDAFFLNVASCQAEPPILGILDGSRLNFYDWKQQRLVGTKALKRPSWARDHGRLQRSGAVPGAGAVFVEVDYGKGPKVIHAFAVPSAKPLPDLQRRIQASFESPAMSGLAQTANAAFVENVNGSGARIAFVNHRVIGDQLPLGQPEEVRVWDETKGKVISTVPSDLTGPVALSKGGELVATVRGHRDVRVFRVESGRDYNQEKRELLAQKAGEMGVSVRFGYREGPITKRYVPEITDLRYAGSEVTLYLNGRPMDIGGFASELGGVRDEVVERFIAFFGVENRSSQDMMVDLLIEAPISISDWQIVSLFWNLGEKHVLVTKEARLLLRKQFGVRAGETLKDQIALGEKKPTDLSVSMINVAPLEPGWLSGLERILAAEVDSWESATAIREEVRELRADQRARGYRRLLDAKLLETEGLIAGHERERMRELVSVSVDVSENYDPDFFNDVEVQVTSTASSPLKVLVRGPNGKSFVVTVPAHDMRSHTVQIQQVPREELLFEVVEATLEER